MMKTTWDERTEWAGIIKPLREKKRWTQIDLARTANVSLSSIQKIEAGTEGSRKLYDMLLAILRNEPKKRTARLPS